MFILKNYLCLLQSKKIKNASKIKAKEERVIGVADASAYKQFGKSLAVPAIQATAQEIIKRLKLKKIAYYGTIK
mgnify:CR=1 FL=1